MFYWNINKIKIVPEEVKIIAVTLDNLINPILFCDLLFQPDEFALKANQFIDDSTQ